MKQKQKQRIIKEQPLALRIGSARKLRTEPISQRTLEYHAGVGNGHLTKMEASKSIPQWFRQLLAISYILGVSVNELIATHIKSEILSEIRERNEKAIASKQKDEKAQNSRQKSENDRINELLPSVKRPDYFLAAVVRCQFLCIAVIRPSQDGRKADIIDIERRALKGENKLDQIRGIIFRVAGNYSIKSIIVEPDSPVYSAMTYTGARLTIMPIRQAVDTVLPSGEPRKLAPLFNHLVHEYPKLQGVVTILKTGRVALTKTWQIYPLLAVALGLAADELANRLVQS